MENNVVFLMAKVVFSGLISCLQQKQNEFFKEKMDLYFPEEIKGATNVLRIALLRVPQLTEFNCTDCKRGKLT